MLNKSLLYLSIILLFLVEFSLDLSLSLGLILMILLICSAVAKGVSYLFSDLSTLLFMSVIPLWFSYFLITDLTVDVSRVLLFGFPSISGALPDVFFHNIYVMRIE